MAQPLGSVRESPAPLSTQPYGVLYTGGHLRDEFPTNAALTAVLGAGAHWVRVTALQRQQIHKRSGDFNWNKADRALGPILASSSRAMVVVVGSCFRDSTSPRAYDATRYLPWPLDGHSEYCEALAARYAGKVAVYEIWNEPGWKLPAPRHNAPDDFARLVDVSVAAIQRQDPAARVICGGFHGKDLLRERSWTRRCVELLVAEPYGLAGLSFHLIRAQSPRADILRDAERVLRLVRDLGWSGEVHLTEVGYSSHEKFQESNPRYRGEEGQANWLRDTLPELAAMGYATVIWALLEDGENYGLNQRFGRNGLFRSYEEGWTPKPAAWAFKALL